MILVTGGAGFIGSHLVRRLLRDQLGPITVLDNLSRTIWPELALERPVRFVRGDIRNAEVVREAIHRAEVIFHLAAISSVIGASANIDDSFSCNTEGTLRLLQAARHAKTRRFVFTSSREVYGEPEHVPVSETAPLQPKNAYGASKASAEMYCLMFGHLDLEVSVLRLANVYGPGDRDRVMPLFVENALIGRPLVVFGGQQLIDFVEINYVVETLLAAGFGQTLAGPVNVGSGKGTTVSELSSRVIDVTRSCSDVDIRTGRAVEVSRFVADTKRADSSR